jgi:hypothetical protein
MKRLILSLIAATLTASSFAFGEGPQFHVGGDVEGSIAITAQSGPSVGSDGSIERYYDDEQFISSGPVLFTTHACKSMFKKSLEKACGAQGQRSSVTDVNVTEAYRNDYMPTFDKPSFLRVYGFKCSGYIRGSCGN